MLARTSLKLVPRSFSASFLSQRALYRPSYATFCTAKDEAGPVFRKKLQSDMATAMKGGDSGRLAAIRLIKSKITVKDKETGVELDHNGIVQVMYGMMTVAADTEKEMKSHSRDDLAQKERVLIDTIKSYLPEQLSVEDVKKEVQEIITKINATSMKEMGKVIEAASKTLQGKAQNKVIADVAKELLSAKK